MKELQRGESDESADANSLRSFGDQLKWIRLHKGLTQEELAQKLGTSKQLISRYETGQTIPKISVVSEFAEKLHVSMDFLAHGTLSATKTHTAFPKDENRIEDLVRVKYGKQAVELLLMFERLNARGKSKLLENITDLTCIRQYAKEAGGRSMECRAIAYGGAYKKSIINEEQSTEATLLIKKIELDEI
ncbi:MAG: helix-turn-helix transcriptional regulator [Clostridiales bacterium]|nr:helix-turn-helix transcriptional regulator [Clostridiales bacterium]